MGIFGKIKNDLSKTFPPKADQPRAGKNIFKSPSASLRVNKRFFVIILLFFVLSGIIFPKTANAIPWWISPAGWFLGDATTNAFANTVSFIFAGGPLFLTAFIADLMYAILMIVVGWTQTIKYGSSDAVMLGWPIVRDFANMFVVLGLVVIGLATILRFHDYEAKKLLPKLIIAALLINFSLVICGVFIDGSNIITNYFFTKGQSGLSLFTQNLQKALNLISIESLWKDNFMAYSAKIYSLVFFNFISIIIFLLYGAMLLFRIVALYILVILSPLAFVAAVFPGKPQEFYKMWKNNFMQWCIIGIPAGLFYYIGSNMMQKATTTPLNFDGSLMSIEAIVNKVSSFASLIFIPSAFLIIGFLFALKTSAMGADIITSRANKAWGGIKKYAGTGAKAGAGKLTNISGATGWYNANKDRITRSLEGSILKRGHTQSAQQKRMAADKTDTNINAEDMVAELRANRAGYSNQTARAKYFEKLVESNQTGLLNDAERRRYFDEAVATGSRADKLIKGLGSGDVAGILNDPVRAGEFNGETRTAGMRTLRERGDLDRIVAGRRGVLVNEAVQYGEKIGDFAKADYRYREYDVVGPNARAAAAGSNPNAIGPQEAIEEQLRTNWSNMSGGQRRGVDAIHLTSDFLTSRQVNADNLSDLRTLINDPINSPEDALRLATLGTPGPTPVINPILNTAINDAITDAGTNTREIQRLNGIRTEILRILTRP